jgi:cytidyltransferase-like protein
VVDALDPTRPPQPVVVAGLDHLGSAEVRLLDEASRLGRVHARLWSDSLVGSLTGGRAQFPEAERRFFVANLRYVDTVGVVDSPQAALRPVRGLRPSAIVAPSGDPGDAIRGACEKAGVRYLELGPDRLGGFPAPMPGSLSPTDSTARRVVVSGCFDWLHSGHVEFFRDASALGDLYVVVGSDRNVRLLKGAGHPLHREDERLYMVQAVRPVHRALRSTGTGWMDAEPEIEAIRPHVYVVNEDGDRPEKRDFCREHGLEYVVLRRRPHRGLPRRTSTDLRGF